MKDSLKWKPVIAFWMIAWFNASTTLVGAAITAMFDWKAGWTVMAGFLGLMWVIWKHNPERIARELLEQKNLLLQLENNGFKKSIVDFTDGAIVINEENVVYCQACGSRHSKLAQYPFDWKLHDRHCKIPGLRAKVSAIDVCPDSELQDQGLPEPPKH